jgi:FdhE protein
MGLEAPSQVVPPGSRQVLSSDKTDLPATAFGENTLGEIAESDPVHLPDLATVFSRRAERLNELAPGHELEGFLRMIAALVRAQHAALAGLPPGALPGRASLDPAGTPRDETWRVALSRLLASIDPAILPEAARAAREQLTSAAPRELEALADRFLGGNVTAADAARTVFVAAALQVAWTRMAALLDKADLAAGKDPTGECPVCGSPALAGLVMPGGTRFGHRHLHCSLCASSWRYVRAKCVHCGSTGKVSFRQLSGAAYARAECCEKCHGYSKVFYVDKVKPVEALADDLASLGLDVLVGEEGFSRAPNPFVLGIMEQPEG